MILMVPISLTLSPHSRLYELRNASDLQKFIRCFCMIMRPVHVPQATASPTEMKLT